MFNKMEKHELTIGEYTVSIYSLDDSKNCPVIYMNLAGDVTDDVVRLLVDKRVILVTINGLNWDHDLTPWYAPRIFQDGNDFGDGADVYLQKLTGSIIPAVEAALGFSPCCRTLLGYSLAGLFAIYALYCTDIFDRVASISGSLWYDGFLDFMGKKVPLRQPQRVYFSLGDSEQNTKNPRLATVQNCTLEAENLMQRPGTKTVFEINPGGHFSDIPKRIAKGIQWIL
jgi:predicted alpha/beta superfamily hydrolase